jgi:hypothetical protein
VKNRIEDVRNHLVAAMEALNEENLSAEQLAQAVERGKAVSSLATAFINAVKVETDAVRLFDETGMLPGSVAAPIRCNPIRGSLGLNSQRGHKGAGHE